MGEKAAAIIRLDLSNLKFSSTAFSYYRGENREGERSMEGTTSRVLMRGPLMAMRGGPSPAQRGVSR